MTERTETPRGPAHPAAGLEGLPCRCGVQIRGRSSCLSTVRSLVSPAIMDHCGRPTLSQTFREPPAQPPWREQRCWPQDCDSHLLSSLPQAVTFFPCCDALPPSSLHPEPVLGPSSAAPALASFLLPPGPRSPGHGVSIIWVGFCPPGGNLVAASSEVISFIATDPVPSMGVAPGGFLGKAGRTNGWLSE